MARMEHDQCVKHVGDPSHLSHLSSGLNQLRHQAAFCDVTIIVGHQRFPAHKAVLSCASDYFQGMFTSGFQESTMGEISVPGTEESFAQFLDLAYTGHFTLSLRTVTGVFKMACYMVFTKAVELSAEYLRGVKDKLAIEDCFEIWSIANHHSSLEDIAKMYRSRVIQNFLKFVKSQVFVENSSAIVMMEILSDEEIETDTTTEEQILQGTVMWLKHDWEQRKVHAVDLLKKIRLGLVPVNRLQEILGDEIMAIPACKEMVEEVVKLIVTKDTSAPLLIGSHPDWFATRNTITAGLWVDKEDVVDDDDYDEASSMLQLKCSTGTACYKLTKIADIPDKAPYFDPLEDRSGIDILITDSGYLYAAGGNDEVWTEDAPEEMEDHLKWLSENNFFSYSSEKNEWSVLPPMPKVLFFPILYQLEEHIIALGSAEFGSKSMIERYSITSNTWEIVVDDIGCLPVYTVTVDGNILLTGKLVVQGPNRHGGNGGFVVMKHALYKPTTNEWLEVSVNRSVDEEDSFEVWEGVCYFVTKGKDQEPDKINECICDFDSDSPSIAISHQAVHVKDNIYSSIKEKRVERTKDHNSVEFTFDKRKLGLMVIPCKCASHVKGKQMLI
ncbi:kelch repeat and BTB domain-containing protein 2-like [Amphiura filiformis]|uniref:kelch repeat and BTB domain-containing protein 2-like n=1 Tax=Amphiura filiformis TaxID=82378 RepID=UPI003B215D9E